jgi:hypothetical protein
VITHQSAHRSSGARRGVAGGGVTMAEVGQVWALKHPRWRGHPPGKWVEVTAQPSFLSTGGGKNRTAAAFSDEVGAPVAGGVLHRGGKEEEAHAQVYSLKKVTRGGGCSGLRSLWRGSRRWR